MDTDLCWQCLMLCAILIAVKPDLQDVYLNEEDPKGQQGCRTHWVRAECCSGNVLLVSFFQIFFLLFRISSLISIFYVNSGIVRLGEHPSRAQEWLEGLVHQLCKVWSHYLHFFYIVILISVSCFFFFSQIDVSGNRKAVVIHVPYRLRKPFRKIHTKLVRELEKKFSGKVTSFLQHSLLWILKMKPI